MASRRGLQNTPRSYCVLGMPECSSTPAVPAATSPEANCTFEATTSPVDAETAVADNECAADGSEADGNAANGHAADGCAG